MSEETPKIKVQYRCERGKDVDYVYMEFNNKEEKEKYEKDYKSHVAGYKITDTTIHKRGVNNEN